MSTGRRLLVLATTLDRLVLGSRPFWRTDGRPVRFTSIAYDARAVLRHARARCSTAARIGSCRKVFDSFGAERVELTLDSPFTIDGEFFEPEPGRPLVVTAADSGPLRQAVGALPDWPPELLALLTREAATPAPPEVMALADAARAEVGDSAACRAVLRQRAARRCRRRPAGRPLRRHRRLRPPERRLACPHAGPGDPAQRLLCRDHRRRRGRACQIRRGGLGASATAGRPGHRQSLFLGPLRPAHGHRLGSATRPRRQALVEAFAQAADTLLAALGPLLPDGAPASGWAPLPKPTAPSCAPSRRPAACAVYEAAPERYDRIAAALAVPPAPCLAATAGLGQPAHPRQAAVGAAPGQGRLHLRRAVPTTSPGRSSGIQA